MKKLLLLLFAIPFVNNLFAQTGTCASPYTVSSGGCVTITSFGAGGAAGSCGNNDFGGGSVYIRFTASSCDEFDITSLSGNLVLAYHYFYSGACPGTAITLPYACHNGAQDGETYTVNSMTSNTDATPLLVSGTQYYLRIVPRFADGTANGSLEVCHRANVTEKANNECGGATGLGGGTQSFYNGGNCSYTGSLNDATTTDQIPDTHCAGSLENTQWVVFAPAAGATSFTINGSNMWCTGGGCGWQFGIFSGSCASLTPEWRAGRQTGSCPGDGSCGPDNYAGGLAEASTSTVTNTTFSVTFVPTAPATSFTGSERFYLVMDGNANADCHYDLTGVNITPLSNEQGILKATKRSGNNVLMWSASAAFEQAEFVLQRSKDGQRWDNIFFAPAKNTGDVVNYNYTDANYGLGTTYYRVMGFLFPQHRLYPHLLCSHQMLWRVIYKQGFVKVVKNRFLQQNQIVL
jgi:hypothetical protein